MAQSLRARWYSPISHSAETSQNEQMVKLPSSPREAVVGLLDLVAQHQAVHGQLVGDRQHRGADPRVVRRQEAEQRGQQQGRVERLACRSAG